MRLCWVFPDRGTGRQRELEEKRFWKHYRNAALNVGMEMSIHAPESITAAIHANGELSIHVDGTRVAPADTIFVTELYTFPHQVVDAFNQVSLFMVLERAGFYLPITPSLSLVTNDKLATLLYLRDSPVPPVPTIRLGSGREGAPRASVATATMGYPMVVKPAGWGGGQGVCLARDEEELRSLIGLAGGSESPLVCQPYLGEATVDYRLYIIDGRIHTAICRTPRTGSLTANVAQGGLLEPVTPPEELALAVPYLVERFPLPYFAADFLFDGKQFWLSEVELDGAVGYADPSVVSAVLESRFKAYLAAHRAWVDQNGEASERARKGDL